MFRQLIPFGDQDSTRRVDTLGEQRKIAEGADRTNSTDNFCPAFALRSFRNPLERRRASTGSKTEGISVAVRRRVSGHKRIRNDSPAGEWKKEEMKGGLLV